jgi:myo-inositol-hexaphosphate 3-phosphohydrolase
MYCTRTHGPIQGRAEGPGTAQRSHGLFLIQFFEHNASTANNSPLFGLCLVRKPNTGPIYGLLWRRNTQTKFLFFLFLLLRHQHFFVINTFHMTFEHDASTANNSPLFGLCLVRKPNTGPIYGLLWRRNTQTIFFLFCYVTNIVLL